jgi:acetyl-CoA/propionyl-CoA carboxylase biotin carboxyl carrier protein
VFARVLIANRGEIAVRIARTCADLGIETVAVHSDADEGASHVAMATTAVALSGAAYLDPRALVEAARATGAEAVHPGYGFLAENAGFAETVVSAGLAWVGPPPDVARAVGDKVNARRIALAAGVPVVPGSPGPVASASEAASFAAAHGYPIALKAAGGGGGRGLRIARAADDVPAALEGARREAEAHFGAADVYVERLLEAPKHVEVQVLAPHPGEALWLGVRDCSLQRRHQKLVEETPPPRPCPEAEMGEAAMAIAKACGYVGAGTVEMLLDRDGAFYFLEVNARLQVEHTVTEEVFGVDLVEAQLRVAAGEPLGFGQAELEPRGHAIECRINAEDPAAGFAPSPGRIDDLREPAGPGVRVDSGYRAGDTVPRAYDSLIAKVIARGSTREQARRRMLRALHEMRVEGVATTLPAQRLLVGSEEFRAGIHTVATVERSGVLEPLRARPADGGEAPRTLLVEGRAARLWHPAMAASAGGGATGGTAPLGAVAPMQGTIATTLVGVGDEVEAGAPVAVLEAMKMETVLAAPAAGTVAEIVRPGETVAAGSVVVRIAPRGE